MPVQALFLGEVHSVVSLRYAWAEDGTVLLALDCHVGQTDAGNQALTFSELAKEIAALCPWQKLASVTIGTKHAFAEVLTVYHAFESAESMDCSLMLVSTPPDEYFEAA